MLEWKDPLGLRGCGVFYIQKNAEHFDRNYCKTLSNRF